MVDESRSRDRSVLLHFSILSGIPRVRNSNDTGVDLRALMGAAKTL
jgi:hypothetical protein